ncbi:MAG: AbrB/MazE/SpoVT family DNA-binding domain-containing protein [archaeon]
MKEQFIRVVRKSGGSLSVNLPKEIVKLLNLKDGNIVKIIIEKRK